MAVSAFATVWGDSKLNPKGGTKDSGVVKPEGKSLPETLAETKFSKDLVATYETTKGESLFAHKLQPSLETTPAKPCDILVMVDTSASQAGQWLKTANQITATIAGKAGAKDRVSVWTVNIPTEKSTKCLTGEFVAPTSEKLKAAIETLQKEFPLGDTDLKEGLNKAIHSFGSDPERRRAIVFLGDGMSIHNPISVADRAKLAADMIKLEIGFFPIPLGPQVDPHTLHGLAIGTGGLAVRLTPKEKADDLVKRLNETIAAPVLYPSSVTIAEAKEFLPTKLPPLRSDSPNLIVGHFKGGKTLTCKIEGTVAGKKVTVNTSTPVSAPEADNFFLVGLFSEWNKVKERPATMRADRALAYAHQANLMARSEYLAQAEMALAMDQLAAADILFDNAKKLDPKSGDADAGMQLVKMLREGKVTKEELRKSVEKDQDKVNVQAALNRAKNNENVQEKPVETPKDDPIKLHLQKQQVEEQRVKLLVDDALRQANRVLPTDPDSAHELLKRTLGGVRDNPDLTAKSRDELVSRLENGLRNVDLQGREIKRRIDEQMALLASAEERDRVRQKKVAGEELTRERIRAIHELMNEGRFTNAYRMAQDMRYDALNSGQPIPVAATSAYDIGLAGGHFREMRELIRKREQNYLRSMMQVERAFMPYDDEVPVHFPPAKEWRKMTLERRELYESSGLIENDPVAKRMMKALTKKLNEPINFEGLNGTLGVTVEFLKERYKFTIILNAEAFDTDLQIKEPEGVPIILPKMNQVTLSTVLSLIAKQIAGGRGAYCIRRDFVEITTAKRQFSEKAVRVYPILDLVTPIPSQINPIAASQNAFFSTQAAMINNPQAFNPFAGALGGNAANNNNNNPAPLGQGVPVNIAGAFGAMGGDLSTQLVYLIREVVAKGEWAIPVLNRQPNQIGAGGGNCNAAGCANPKGGLDPLAPDHDEGILPKDLNTLGYYGPAGVLIVRATSRVHSSIGGGELNLGPVVPIALQDNGAVVRGPDGDKKPVKPGDDPKKDPKKDPVVKKDDKKLDPKTIWKNALARGTDDPGLIIACSDFLAQCREFEHAAEFLKANLREGIVTQPWVYEALALALREAKGSSDEIERAQVSCVDVDPKNARGFIRASRIMAENNRYDRAVAYCRQASLLEPTSPYSYEEGLLYAELGQDSESMEWAAGNLLARDWPAENERLHLSAKTKLDALAKSLIEKKVPNAANRMKAAVENLRRRDLSIVLKWQGDADLDLAVKEPIGTSCSGLQRQSAGGGIFLGDNLADMSRESYVAAEAFSGEYEISIRTVWGRPLGGKATLEIVEHQGTSRETRRPMTFVFDRNHSMKFTLKDGRRTAVAEIAPVQAKPKSMKTSVKKDLILNQLRSLASPGMIGSHAGFSGDAGSTSGLAKFGTGKKSVEEKTIQSKMETFVPNSAAMITETKILRDGSTVTKLKPVFQTLTKSEAAPVVKSPFIPDGN